jgi:hypothetical protein
MGHGESSFRLPVPSTPAPRWRARWAAARRGRDRGQATRQGRGLRSGAEAAAPSGRRAELHGASALPDGETTRRHQRRRPSAAGVPSWSSRSHRWRDRSRYRRATGSWRDRTAAVLGLHRPARPRGRFSLSGGHVGWLCCEEHRLQRRERGVEGHSLPTGGELTFLRCAIAPVRSAKSSRRTCRRATGEGQFSPRSRVLPFICPASPAPEQCADAATCSPSCGASRSEVPQLSRRRQAGTCGCCER